MGTVVRILVSDGFVDFGIVPFVRNLLRIVVCAPHRHKGIQCLKGRNDIDIRL